MWDGAWGPRGDHPTSARCAWGRAWPSRTWVRLRAANDRRRAPGAETTWWGEEDVHDAAACGVHRNGGRLSQYSS